MITKKKERVCRWFIVIDQGNEIGTIWLEQKDLTLNELDLGIFLNEVELMGKGKGRSIIKEFFEDQNNLIQNYKICLDVRTNNERAIKCYRSLGFKEIDKRQKKLGEMIIDYYRMYFDSTHRS